MAKKRSVLKSRQSKPGGGWLTLSVIALAALACIALSPPTPKAVVAVFGKPQTVTKAELSTISLPQQQWYLVISGGKAVAACEALLEAEIAREAYGELATVEPVQTDAITLRVTASRAQLTALNKGADALIETFRAMEQMTHLEPADALSAAKSMTSSLEKILSELDSALSGTENPVVRGLHGLCGSCLEAMRALETDISRGSIQKSLAGLLQQYSAYTAFLSGERASSPT